MKVLAKEASKREESAGLYTKGGNIDRAKQELSERDIIVSYLPKQLTGQELVSIVDETIQELGLNDIRSMGVVIAAIKAKTSGSASGADIANKVRERLS
jgi:uncharacterized protein YqeY